MSRREERPTVAELLAMAADVVAMVDGRVTAVYAAHRQVTVTVTCQADAEHLAWRLGLGTVDGYPPTGEVRGFTVWSGGDRSLTRFEVFCSAELVRPVRAFPRHDLHPSGDVVVGASSEAA